MNRDQADALARFLHLCRPEWDHPGILRALGDAKAGDPLNVGLAAIRWTANPDLRTPGGMGKPGEHWTERVISATPRAPRPDEACRECGRHMHHPDAICERPTLRPATPSDPTPGLEQARHLVGVTKSGLCSHGVPPANCTDHKNTETEETEDA